MSDYVFNPISGGYVPTKSTLFAQAQAAGMDDATLEAAAEVDAFGFDAYPGEFEEPGEDVDEVVREFPCEHEELDVLDLGDAHV